MSPLFNAVGASNGFINCPQSYNKNALYKLFLYYFQSSVYKQVQKTASIGHYSFVSIEKRCSIVATFMQLKVRHGLSLHYPYSIPIVSLQYLYSISIVSLQYPYSVCCCKAAVRDGEKRGGKGRDYRRQRERLQEKEGVYEGEKKKKCGMYCEFSGNALPLRAVAVTLFFQIIQNS